MIGVMESCGVIPDEITPQKVSRGDVVHSLVRVLSILLHQTKPRILNLLPRLAAAGLLNIAQSRGMNWKKPQESLWFYRNDKHVLGRR